MPGSNNIPSPAFSPSHQTFVVLILFAFGTAYADPQARFQKPTELQLKDRKMSGLSDEYRKEAVRCHKNAESSLKEADRAFWLLLAANWLKLAEDRDKISNSDLRDAG